ncbi:unnamed protein product, partial [Sphacelaria rigidula]
GSVTTNGQGKYVGIGGGSNDERTKSRKKSVGPLHGLGSFVSRRVSRGGALSSHGDLHSNTGGGGVGELSTTAVDRLRRSASGVERMAPGNGGAIIGDGSAVGTGDAQKRMDSWGGRLEKAPP